MEKVLATEEEIHEAEYKFYHPELWREHYMARPFPTRVEFDCDEEKMLGEMSAYTGFPRSELAREAVRYMYEEWYLKQPKESGAYYKCHEPIVWVDESSELCDGEVK